MIIGISGAQGQGKSTLIRFALNQGELGGYPYVNMGLQTARGILKDWGYTLDEINGYMPLKLRYQDELFKRHFEALSAVSDGHSCVLVERSFADIYTYALASVGPFSTHNEWLMEYYEKCRKAQRDIFTSVIFLSGREYNPENDGVRSTNPQFSQMVDLLIRQYTMEFSEDNAIINISSLQGRLRELNKIVKQLKGE